MKKVGNRFYIHFDPIAMGSLSDERQAAIHCAIDLYPDAPDVVSFELTKTGYHIGYAWCDDWQGKHEPAIMRTASFEVVGNTYKQKAFTTYKVNRPIYHGKHFFVVGGQSEYNQFDVDAEKKRYEAYKALKPNPLKMGRENYWNDWCHLVFEKSGGCS